jgi:ABC-2 type transport system permease protein
MVSAPGTMLRRPGSTSPDVRRGARHWISGYVTMLRFDLASQRNWLPMFVLTQIMFGAGMAIIYGFYVGHAPASVIRYIVTGAPTLAVITAALIGVSTIVTERQLAGSWDFIWSLPTPRSAAVASTFTVYTAMTIPGIVAALALASWRYGVHLTLSPSVVPAFVLSSLMATSMGFAMAICIPNPIVTNVIVNALIFVVLLFSPVVYPISQLPAWLADVQRGLPVYHLAQVMRASLTAGMVHGLAMSYLVLALWTAASWAAAAWVIGRRK